MAQDTWVSLQDAAALNGRSPQAFLERVTSGKIRSKRRMLPPFSRVYWDDDAERDALAAGAPEVESEHDRWARKLRRDTPESQQ